MSKRIVSLSLLAVLVLAAGVWLSSAAGPGGAEPGRAPDQTIDDIYAQMALEVPGFAGMRLGPDGETIQVFFKGASADAEPSADLRRAVDGFFQAAGDLPPEKIEVLPAQYDFLQLRQWYDRMRDAVWSVPGVVFTDIDEVKNRLDIGVETEEAAELVEKRLRELGIPREAVDIEISEPVVPDSSLRDRHRPLVGGLEIIGDYAGTSECTLGFNAKRAGVEGFVTASHCSEVLAGVDGTGFYQPTIVTSRQSYQAISLALRPWTRRSSPAAPVRLENSVATATPILSAALVASAATGAR